MNNTNEKKALEKIQDYLRRQKDCAEAALLGACRRQESTAAKIALDALIESHCLMDAVCAVDSSLDGAEVPTYCISSLLVRDAIRILTPGRNEVLRFASGVKVRKNVYVVTSLLDFELELASPVFAKADHTSMTRALIELHNYSHLFLMTWHSHPGLSASSTYPSSIDIDFHRRLEVGGYPVIGGIVNRAGFVRFYSDQRKFVIEPYGQQMEVQNESENVYRIASFGKV